jgi:hypothetical protein
MPQAMEVEPGRAIGLCDLAATRSGRQPRVNVGVLNLPQVFPNRRPVDQSPFAASSQEKGMLISGGGEKFWESQRPLVGALLD